MRGIIIIIIIIVSTIGSFITVTTVTFHPRVGVMFTPRKGDGNVVVKRHRRAHVAVKTATV